MERPMVQSTAAMRGRMKVDLLAQPSGYQSVESMADHLVVAMEPY